LEREICLRERAAGAYSVSAYVLAKTLCDCLAGIPPSLAYSFTVYWLVGFRPGVHYFAVFAAVQYLDLLAAMAVAVMFSAVCRTITLAVTMIPTVFELGRLFGGWFLQPNLLPTKFVWIDALSFVKYAYVGIALNELQGLELHCDPHELDNGVCHITNGDQIIAAKGFNKYTVSTCCCGLIAIFLASRFVAYLGLRFIKW
jgi:ATP-binding cassette subfamily G (WHITE) protein 2